MTATIEKERNIQIAKEYAEGVLSPALSEKYGISRQRVWQILGQFGVKSHSRHPNVSGDDVVNLGLNAHVYNLADIAARMGMSMQSIRNRVRSNAQWPLVLSAMRIRRHNRDMMNLRVFVFETYKAEKERLGRQLTVAEMRSVRIWPVTLNRLYGKNYINKFRVALGEVPNAQPEE